MGPAIHFNLDSGYLQSYKSQVAYIEESLQEHRKYYRFANFHNPIYPVCFNPIEDPNDAEGIVQAKKYWVPLFDKWNFTAIF